MYTHTHAHTQIYSNYVQNLVKNISDVGLIVDQVMVLESRDRLGGRVHTDYSFGFPVDLGASW